MLLYNEEKKQNIDEIIKEGLERPIVKYFCMQSKNKNKEQIEEAQKAFSKFIGFCILFRSLEDIEIYMLLKNKEEQIKFLKKKLQKK